MHRIVAVAVALAACAVASPAAHAAPGELDGSFGQGGLVLDYMDAYSASADDVALGRDGRIYILDRPSMFRPVPA